jgi:hypothetical protein
MAPPPPPPPPGGPHNASGGGSRPPPPPLSLPFEQQIGGFAGGPGAFGSGGVTPTTPAALLAAGAGQGPSPGLVGCGFPGPGLQHTLSSGGRSGTPSVASGSSYAMDRGSLQSEGLARQAGGGQDSAGVGVSVRASGSGAPCIAGTAQVLGHPYEAGACLPAAPGWQGPPGEARALLQGRHPLSRGALCRRRSILTRPLTIPTPPRAVPHTPATGRWPSTTCRSSGATPTWRDSFRSVGGRRTGAQPSSDRRGAAAACT